MLPDDSLDATLGNIISDRLEIVNILVDYFYGEKNKASKSALWENYGSFIYQNVREKTDAPVLFPTQCKDGEITYMGTQYKVTEVDMPWRI